MSSKRDMLERIRRHALPDAALPDLQEPWLTFADRERQFIEVVASVGGQVAVVPDRADLNRVLCALPCLTDAQRVVIGVPGVQLLNVDVSSAADPQAAADVDVAVLPAEFAVAENGAVWTTDQACLHRSLLFLTQHLILVVPRQQIVDHMHQAYARLRFEHRGYGLFISGPSKTADIEQSLVIGAHGPRSMTVILEG